MTESLRLARDALVKMTDPQVSFAEADEAHKEALAAIDRELATDSQSFQDRVQPWMATCFPPDVCADELERMDRFVEEALEAVQSRGYPAERVEALKKYVYGRPVGEPRQEIGGVMITLAAWCGVAGIDMHEAGEAELARVWTKIEAIRAKQASKPTGSALPVESNDNPKPPKTYVMFSDLVAASGLSEDEMLHRFAKILAKRIGDQTSKPELLAPPWLTPAVQERIKILAKRMEDQTSKPEPVPDPQSNKDRPWWRCRMGCQHHRECIYTTCWAGSDAPAINQPQTPPWLTNLVQEQAVVEVRRVLGDQGIDTDYSLARQVVLAVLAACVPEVEALRMSFGTHLLKSAGPKAQLGNVEVKNMRAALLAAMRGE
jgi:hypothetical protein